MSKLMIQEINEQKPEQKADVCEKILRELPDWFGIEPFAECEDYKNLQVLRGTGLQSFGRI